MMSLFSVVVEDLTMVFKETLRVRHEGEGDRLAKHDLEVVAKDENHVEAVNKAVVLTGEGRSNDQMALVG